MDDGFMQVGTRRAFLRRSAAVSGAVLAGPLIAACGGSGSKGTTTGAGGKPGQLNVLYATVEAASDAFKMALPAYKSKFGIDLHVDTIPYNALQQKVFSELASSSSHYDIIIVDTPWMPSLTDKVEPLDAYLQNARLNSADLNVGDFIPKVFYDTAVYNPKAPHQHFPGSTDAVDLQAVAGRGFHVYGLPIQANALTMSYRKDLFDSAQEQQAFRQKYGSDLKVPTTWDEYQRVAEFFTRPSKNLYGTTMMAGVGDWSTDDFKTLLASFGGDGHLVTDDFGLAFHTPEGVQALTYYANLINKLKVTPPGTTAASWDTVTSTFGNGLAAMGLNYHNMQVKGQSNTKVDYAPAPKQVQAGPHFGTWMLSVNKFSKNKEWAYRSIAWLTGSEAQTQMLQGQLHPTRKSVYDHAEGDAKIKQQFGNFYPALGRSLAVGVGRARIKNYFDVSNSVAVAVNEAASGRSDPKTALDKAAREVAGVLKKNGYPVKA